MKMNLRTQIEATFTHNVFERPLFYRYPQGLRFELSTGGNSIEQFLCAHRKALAICEDIFISNKDLAVCIRFWHNGSLFSHRKLLRELGHADIKPGKNREMWSEVVHVDDRTAENSDEQWIHAAFNVPKTLLQNLLWCALATDFSTIRPNPDCLVYLFEMQKKIVVFPYDDRGMDVVGENHDELVSLYQKHNQCLLEYNRDEMDIRFSKN